MMGVDKHSPLIISKNVKDEFPYIPIFMLLNNNSDIIAYKEKEFKNTIDRVFVWNGDSRIFFAMVKYLDT